jgi:hypothetical protein
VRHRPRRRLLVVWRSVPVRLRPGLRRPPRRIDGMPLPAGVPSQSERRSLLADRKPASGHIPGSSRGAGLLLRSGGGHAARSPRFSCPILRQADLSCPVYAADLIGPLIARRHCAFG